MKYPKLDFRGRKPSEIIRAMCDGLEYYDRRDGYVIDMEEFAGFMADGFHCCAATCTIMKLSGIEAAYPKRPCLYTNNQQFATAVSWMRWGDAVPERFFFLEEYLGYCPLPLPDEFLPHLKNDNWRDQLGPYRAYADQLEKAGL